MSEPFLEDWWEGNEPPHEAPVYALVYGRGLADDLFWVWWARGRVLHMLGAHPR